jgi:uncharacterized cupredoxin-like copper-binding protein
VSQPEQIHRQDAHPARRRFGRALGVTAAIAALALGVAACGDDDDGADVRSSGPGASGSGSGSGSASGSGSGSASGSGSGSASGSGSGSAVAGECEVIDGTDGVADASATVAVTLSEFSIAIDPATVAAGAIGLVAENAGAEPHEVVIARGTPEDITVVDGAPDEAALGDALVGEIEAFAAGQTCEGTFELTAGDYVLFCALVETEEDGTVESHYEEGMVTTLTVE